MSLEHLDDEQPTIDALFSSADTAEFALALERILSEWRDEIIRIMVSILCDFHDAEDCLQAFSLGLWKKRGQFNDIQNLKGFVLTSARNIALHRLRDKKRHAGKNKRNVGVFLAGDLGDDAFESFDSVVMDPVDLWLNFREQFSRVLARFSQEHQKIFSLFLTGMSVDEIASAVNRQPITIQNVIREIKQCIIQSITNYSHNPQSAHHRGDPPRAAPHERRRRRA